MMILCIDAGASSSKWTAKSLDKELISGKVAPLTGHIFDELGFQNARSILEEIKTGFVTVEACDEVVIGVTGLDKESEISQQIARIISEVFEVDMSNICVMSDIELAYGAILDLGSGILIYAGTGAIAVSVDRAGILHRAGGWGFHNGDDGGGYSIGRAALRYVTGLWDIGVDPLQDFFANAVLSKASAKYWPELRNYVYGGGRSAVGDLALVVMEQANTGSELALQILRDAGLALAKVAKALNDRLNLNNFVAMGGTFRLHPLILDSLSEALGSEVTYFDVDISQQWIKRHRKGANI
jgi:glucosamine kinase